MIVVVTATLIAGAIAGHQWVRSRERTFMRQLGEGEHAQYIGDHIRNYAYWVLWSRLVIALGVGAVLWQLLRYRRRELIHTETYLAALESLNEISAAISAGIGSGRQVLDQLAQFACQLLGMNRSGVGLLDESGKLQIQAFAGDIPATPPTSFAIGAHMPAITRCLQTGQMLFEEDVSRPKLPINTDVTAQFNAGSVILIPLNVEGRAIGLMALSDTRPRQFTPAERRLAQLLVLRHVSIDG